MTRAKTTATQSEVIPNLSPHALSHTLIERLPLPYPLIVVLISALVIGEQILEESLVGPLSGYATLQRLGIRVALPVLSIYLLVANRLLKRKVIECLNLLETAVQIDSQIYDELREKMLRPKRWIELLLLLLSSAIVVNLFLIMRYPLPIYTSLTLPSQPITAGFIMLVYILVGWIGLTLVYTGLQHAIYLSQLSRQPLNINVFDPENLLPFGTISLIHNLVLVGVVVVLLALLGRPTSPASFLVIALASIGSLLGLVLPLLGVFQQMRRAKIKALNNISDQLLQAQEHILRLKDPLDESVSELNARVNALVNLRRTILESPNWPFRSNTALARAVLAALSPIIYFVLIELVREYLVPLLIG